jgi:hypothetical protein
MAMTAQHQRNPLGDAWHVVGFVREHRMMGSLSVTLLSVAARSSTPILRPGKRRREGQKASWSPSPASQNDRADLVSLTTSLS